MRIKYKVSRARRSLCGNGDVSTLSMLR